MCNQREAGASPPSLPEIFFHVQPARGGGKPSFLTWNLLPCATGARRGQAHLPYLESSSMCNRREAGQALLPYLESSSMCDRRKAGASPPSLLEIFFHVQPARGGASPPSLPGIFFHVQPAQGGGKPTFLTWNLLPCATAARGGASPPSLPGIFFHVQPTRGGGKPTSLPGIFFHVHRREAGASPPSDLESSSIPLERALFQCAAGANHLDCFKCARVRRCAYHHCAITGMLTCEAYRFDLKIRCVAGW